MSENPYIFDRARLKQHRDRAAASFSQYDFLLREMATRLAERLEYVKRTFPVALDLGAHTGLLGSVLDGRGGIETLIQSDLSHGMIAQANGARIVADEEFLPFADNSLDLVMSVGSLHWVNDLPGTMIQIFRALKPNGLFLATLPGAQTLKELRQAMEKAEAEVSGGLSPRISPFVDVRDAGGLLQRAGFQLPVIDSELLDIRYEQPFSLLADLRGMGETNALLQSKKTLGARALIPMAMQMYDQQYRGEDGRVPATFELVTMTGWKS